MIWATMVAALALLAWRLGRNPTDDAAPLGLVLFLAGVLLATALSNRVQRRIRVIAACVVCRLWFDRREARQGLLAPLRRVGTLTEFFERLPGVTVSAAGVEPVTLFVLDDDESQYVPVSSTLPSVPCGPVGADEPLVKALSHSRRVHYLRGRTDDLENAPIFAVNGQQVEECQAACALPLRRDGTLVAFLLCGGTVGSPGLRILSSGCLEGLGQRYSDLLKSCPDADLTIAGRLATHPVARHRSVNA
jgi:hypothetical protein